MGVHNFLIPPITGTSSSSQLVRFGPMVYIKVAIPQILESLYQKNNTPIPQPQEGFAIIDTGASTTYVCQSVISSLGVQQLRPTTSNNGGGQSSCGIYPAKISFPNTSLVRNLEEVIDMADIPIMYAGKKVIGVIGREVLSECIFIYNGQTGAYTLAN